MKVIQKLPGEPAEIIEVENDLKALQKKVGGYIETVTFARNACVICNEEGRLLGLPFNAVFCGIDFVGPILVVGVDGEEFTDLPHAEFIPDALGGHS